MMTCKICGSIIEPDDFHTMRFARHLHGDVHWDCIPAFVREGGELAVCCWLRWGSTLVTPEEARKSGAL